MVKIIVAVTGLVLVEIHGPEGPVDLYFPETAGFTAPVVSSVNRPPSPLAMPTHNFAFAIGESADGRPVAASAAQNVALLFDLESPATGWTANHGEASYFPSIDRILKPQRAEVRPGCRYSKPADWKCEGKNARGVMAPLLAGQLRLDGDWRLLARVTQHGTDLPSDRVADRASLMRLLVDDATLSTAHSSSGTVFADTFVFEALVDAPKALTVSAEGMTLPTDLVLTKPHQEFCDAWEKEKDADCRFIWLRNGPASNGPEMSPFLMHGDPHFSQLYRLLTIYDPSKDVFGDDIYVPFSPVGLRLEPMGDRSPICYGGLIER